MKISFLGSGKMASALVRGVALSGVIPPADLLLFSRNAASAEKLAAASGAELLGSARDLAEQSEAMLICVKPGDAAAVLAGIRDPLSGKLLISVMAGVTLAKLQELAGPAVRIIRAMPNTPCLVRQGATSISPATNATEADVELATKIFRAVGTAWPVPEKLIDAVIGVSGSGPAYIYLVIEALADGGVLAGLPRATALALATQTVAGAAAMVAQTGEHPAALKDAVASPGGTTIAALEALEIGGLRATLIAAVRAAAQRSKELSA